LGNIPKAMNLDRAVIKKIGIRFKDIESYEKFMFHGDASGGIKRGQNGYRTARYEAVYIIHPKTLKIKHA
jgi:hypothetical protein